MPPPANVLADADVRLIVPVPVTVRLVDVPQLHEIALDTPASVHVPEPISTVRVFEFEEVNRDEALESVKLYPAAENVPLFKLKGVEPLALEVKASPKDTDPLRVSIVNACVNVFPALVIV